MKRTTLFAATAVAALAIAGAASAQDFSGPYVGAQIGYAWSDAEMPYGNVGGPFVFSQDDANIDGVVLGGRAGMNWQNGSWIFGVEGDVEWADMSGDDGGSGGDVNGVDVNWQGSIRGRLGYAFDPTTAVFVTAGWQFQDVDADSPTDGDVNETIDGFVYGIGLEHRYNDRWSATIDYRHADMNEQRFSFPIDNYDEGITTDSDTVRIGFNYAIHP